MKNINIDLPKKEKNIVVAIAINYGYFDENNKNFGLGHLCEHYIVSILKNNYGLKNVGAEISDTYFCIFLELDKEEYNKFIKFDLEKELLKISEEIDEKILKNEKNRIEIELEEKYSNIFREISKSIEHKVILSPKFLIRDRLLQIKNIKSFTSKQVSSTIKRLSKTEKILLVGFNGNQNNFEDFNKKLFFRKYKLIFNKKRKLSFKSNNKILKKAQNFAIVFRGLNIFANQTDRLALSFLSKKIYEKFDNKVHDFGVYGTDYKFLTEQKYGLVWFSANSYSKIDKKIIDVFYKIVKEILYSKNIKIELNKFKDDKKKKIKKEWSDYYDRFDWALYDILDMGKVISLENRLKSIESLDVEKMIKIGKKIFSSSNEFTLWG